MEKLSSKEAIFLIITIITNTIVLVTSQIVVESCSSSSIINCIYISIIAIILSLLICKLYKKFDGLNILDISNFLGGKLLKFIIGLVFLAYFSFTIIVLLNRLVDCLQLIFYPMTNTIFISLLFIVGVGLLCFTKNDAISKTNLLLLPIIIVSGILIFIANFKNYNFQNIYPILGNGINSTFISGITNLFSFSGLAYLYFLPSKLKTPSRFKYVTIVSIVVSSIIFLLTIAGTLFMFNNNLSEGELFPMYVGVRYIEFGNFFQRLDSVFLFLRIISFTMFFAITAKLCIAILKDISDMTDDRPIIYPYLLILFSFTMLIKNYAVLDFLQNTIFKILFFTVVIGIGFLILFLANSKLKKKEKKIST